MYKPLPECVTIKKSPIEGLGIYATRDIKLGEEITANYNLYTYPKTGIGIQML
jgi:hypothetical protein